MEHQIFYKIGEPTPKDWAWIIKIEERRGSDRKKSRTAFNGARQEPGRRSMYEFTQAFRSLPHIRRAFHRLDSKCENEAMKMRADERMRNHTRVECFFLYSNDGANSFPTALVIDIVSLV